MRIYSYIIARDFGFAPNPFYGYCTLATCKPKIRKGARVGDWVMGTGAKKRYDLAGHVVYAMRVDEVLDFDGYWVDPRFQSKKPLLNGSLKQLYGDNIYHKRGRLWIQEDSHHSLSGGRPNLKNIERDTGTNRVLISRNFVYLGERAIEIPARLLHHTPTNEKLCCTTQGYRVVHEPLADSFRRWLKKVGPWGLSGMPLEFAKHKEIRA